MKDRNELAQYFNTLGFKYGAEIGVCDGRYSQTLCESIPGLKLLCIDAWKAYPENSQDGTQDQLNKCLRITLDRLKNYNVEIIKKWSLEALSEIKNESLDFVYIDCNHKFDFAMEDIINWSRKVRKGGIVSGHDYWKIKDFGVVEAVDIYVKIHGYKLNVAGEDGIMDGRKFGPSWWFIK
jgi:hypothetical protein